MTRQEGIGEISREREKLEKNLGVGISPTVSEQVDCAILRKQINRSSLIWVKIATQGLDSLTRKLAARITIENIQKTKKKK